MHMDVAQPSGIRAIRWMMYVITAILLVHFAVPERAFAEADCLDQAWADYNDCLMSSPFEWEKKICDHAFTADSYACIAGKLGKILCKFRRTCLDGEDGDYEDYEDYEGDEFWYEY